VKNVYLKSKLKCLKIRVEKEKEKEKEKLVPLSPAVKSTP
jgi:hypothetical protein